jgi:hypothetical protein
LKDVARALVELERMDLPSLRLLHLDLFGEAARSKNPAFLRKKLAFRIQERVEGGLAPWAQARIQELAPQDLTAARAAHRKGSGGRATRPQGAAVAAPAATRDPRLPQAGTVLLREYRGFAHEVEVLEEGFTYRGRRYTSLSTLAREITGTPWNGFAFFGLKAGKVSHGA